MTTLFTATLELAKVLGYVLSSVATADGGNGLNLIDSARVVEAEGFWNGGTLWITSGDQAGNSRKVRNFYQYIGLFTWLEPLAGQVVTGTSYSVISADWPKEMLIQFINQALQDMGDVPAIDTSLTTANTARYALPSGVYNIKRVEIAENVSSAYPYIRWLNWREIDGYLEFDLQSPEPGRTIRLTYEAKHATVSSDASIISDYVDLRLLVWSAAVHAWRWRLQRVGGDKPIFLQMMSEAIQNRDRLLANPEMRKRIPKDPRVPLF
ncbi:MAG: hypothetical protein QME21_17450 [Anaerolineales bacterium]|nr:hypothetical protein [Anaerolineales bacterium]